MERLPPPQPWPRAAHGEVRSPTGRRAFTVESTAAILGVSPRRVRQLGASLRAEHDARDHNRTFLDAAIVEREARKRNRWPPEPPRTPALLEEERAWQSLASVQSGELATLQQRVAELSRLLDASQASEQQLRTELAEARADLRDLAIAHQRLTDITRRKLDRLGELPTTSRPIE